jgi:hypothetical protein
MFFNMPRNTTVQQKGSSAIFDRTSSLHHNPETYHWKFMNKLPISRRSLKATYKTKPSKNSSQDFGTPISWEN